MAYFLNLFSPETYEAFSRSDRAVSGFRTRHQNMAARVKSGDRFICYMTKLGRWCGVLEVIAGPYEDSTPVFYESEDPFVIRFKVKPVVWLPKDKAIPIKDDRIWSTLSFTRGVNKSSPIWTGKLRTSLNAIDKKDGEFLERLIRKQLDNGEVFAIDEREYEKLTTHKVRRPDKIVEVSIPQNFEPEEERSSSTEVRDSIKMQALLASIGAQMGLRIWLPRNDRGAVLTEWKSGSEALLSQLPLNYDETTLKTIEQIDVIWLKGRSIVRAFEVEHTTSIYSGILRMADLLALQPNMDIRLHIVAPEARRDKVFQELRRPVFSLLEKGPLHESCTYLSYDSVREISKERHLDLLSDRLVDKYAEEAEEI